MKLSNEIGKKYGRLTIIEELQREKGDYKRKVKAICECEKIKEYRLHHVTSGKTVSCKCFQREQVLKMGRENKQKNKTREEFVRENNLRRN